jgi:hypothetical protein
MLYLHPPFHMINGVSLFRDHEDLLQWYYLPAMPRLTQVLDTATGVNVPQLQVIKFRGTAGNGGFLNFDVNLGMAQETLEDVRRELKGLEGLREMPRLGPVPLLDGAVKLMLFDVQTGDVPAADTPGVPPPGDAQTTLARFVLKASHNAKPALYGDNQAAFSVQLSQEGVTILEKALQGEMSPIGVVYALDFLALRPAYAVRLDVDWDRVQTHFEEHFRTRIPLIFQSQIDEIVDELIENQVIKIEVDTFVPEGDDNSGLIARRDQAVAAIQDMITETFFKPSLDPMAREDERHTGVHTAGRIVDLIATGGASERSLFSYSKSDITRIDRKRLNVNMSERTTVKRSIFPQGHLSGLFRVLREPGVDLERFILAVDTNDPWFTRRQVQVISRADFAEDAISSLNVLLSYGGEPKNLILDSATPTGHIEWGSLLEDGTLRREVTARYTVSFKGVDGTEQPVSLDSPEEIVTVENLEINPRELYAMVPVPIMALNFPWERYSHVEIQVQYSDAENGMQVADDFLLDKEHTETTWKMFVRNPERTQFRYKVIYRAVNHKDVEHPWVETSDERLILRDPFPTKRTLEVVPVFNWTQVDRVFVDLAYRDETNGVSEEASFEFDEQHTATQKFTVALEDPEQRLVSFQVTVIFKDGTLAEIPPSYTLDRRLMVRSDMKGHKIIHLQPEPIDFVSKKIRDLTVETRYDDPTNGLSFADMFTFKSPQDRAHFEFDYSDGAPAQFAYRIKTRFTNNLSRETDWTLSTADAVVVPVGG